MYPVAEHTHEHDTDSHLVPLSVTDLKQYLYCPRIPYFRHVLSLPRPVTYKMQHGTLQHIELDRLEQRRGLRSYGLREGRRLFHVPVTSCRLGLHGTLDLVISYPNKNSTGYLPVEFKYQEGPIRTNVKYQLAAYAMLLEEVYQTPVRDGVVYQIPTKQIRHVRITDEMRTYVEHSLSAIRHMMQKESFPDPKSRARCTDCEYRRTCNDIR
ncbi:MAG TPA: CRISPR-associated protein Cas4 [Bacilli bacterium]|nr:CRISPR-associated protein Cas4 [Bacilli bacterium]